MIRHLIPRASWSRWYGDALTIDPNGAVELPNGRARSVCVARGWPTTTPANDEVVGGTLCIQWLGILVVIAIGKVR